MTAMDLIPCGKVVKPHGLKGELCIAWHAGSPLILDQLARLYLRLPGSRARLFRPLAWREHQKMVLVMLERISGRDQAEKWRGAEILVSAKDLPPAEDDEVYLYQLMDCRVFLQDSSYLGVLRGFVSQKGGEVWRIITPLGREVLFPAQDHFILKLDPANKEVIIDPPEGLLEIYLQD